MEETGGSFKPEERKEDRDREISLKFRIPRLIPHEARVHLRAARKEMLLAVRSMLDSAIEKMDERDQEGQTRTTRIDIQ